MEVERGVKRMTKETPVAETEAQSVEELLASLPEGPLTREEIREQKISFTMGMLPKSSTMTREEVAELIDSQYG